MTTESGLGWPTWLDEQRRPEVLQYRKELLDRIFKPFAAFGLVAVGFGAWRAIQDGQWGFEIAYLAFYTAGTAIALGFKRVPLEMRARALLIGLLAIAGAGLIRLGIGGPGMLVLVAWCGLTGILRGVRASLVAVGVSIVVIAVVGAALVQGVIVL